MNQSCDSMDCSIFLEPYYRGRIFFHSTYFSYIIIIMHVWGQILKSLKSPQFIHMVSHGKSMPKFDLSF